KPDYAHPYHGLGRALAMKGAWPEAIESFQKCLQGKPSNLLARNVNWDLANAYRTSNDWGNAVACYWRVLELDPKHRYARTALFDSVRSQASRAAAITFFRDFVASKPQNALAHYYLGNAVWFQGNIEESLGHFEKAVQLDPNESESYHSLANNQRRLNKLDE